MKKLAFILCACAIAWGYDSIDEALENGVSSGDVTLYGNYINGQKNPANVKSKNDLSEAGYVVGSVGLAYHSAFYKYLRLAVSFRALGVLYEADRHSQWSAAPLLNNPNRYGEGDASRDFYMNDRTMLGQSYLEYFDGNTSIKLGRVFVDSEWVDRLIDGVWLRNRSLPNMLIEALWVKNSGYVQYNKMTGFYDVNPHSALGLTQLSLKYHIGEKFSIKTYGIATSAVFYAAGVKANARYESSKSYLGLSGHFATSFEQTYGRLGGNSGNGYNTDVKIYVGVKDMAEASAGYISTGSNIGWGSLNTLGNSISPFFMWGGRALLEGVDASLWYGKVMFAIDRVSFAVVYGSTKFRGIGYTSMQDSYDRVNEVNLLVDFGFTEHLSGILNVLNTHGGKELYYPHSTNVNLGVKLAF
ncbi:Opr family porin [Helicobacter typhlonius]|uniref:Opr family porin n=1 Tax=Helicobacter typhlonius TaxID=76936 RepID=UPI002FE28C85